MVEYRSLYSVIPARVRDDKDKRYNPRLDNSCDLVVQGFMFYSWARMNAEKHALNAARKVLDAIEDKFEFD